MSATKVPNRQVSLDSRRIRLEREVKIRVPQFDTFVTEYSGNISTTGMFIITDSPRPPGTVITFEFSVANDWKLIRGQAQVVWVRHNAEGDERPTGMGVRFVELDAQSRRLIRWIVEKHIREGGKPFELDKLRSAIDEALDQVLETDEIEPVAKAPRRTPTPAKATLTPPNPSRRVESRWMPLLVTAFVVVGVVALLFWLTDYFPRQSRGGEANQPAGEASEAGRTAENPPADTPGPAADDAASGETSAAAGETPPLDSAYAAVTQFVGTWSSAWSSQDAEAYLSLYADDFRPEDGLTRSQWAAQRRERITAQAYIRVAISGLEIERTADDRVEATFFQSYRSDRFRDEVRKRFELIWEDGAWRILRETTL